MNSIVFEPAPELEAKGKKDPVEVWVALHPTEADADTAATGTLIGRERELGVVLCVGTYERGPQRGTIYNASVLIDTDGSLLGVYRKTHPFCTEAVSGGFGTFDILQ